MKLPHRCLRICSLLLALCVLIPSIQAKASNDAGAREQAYSLIETKLGYSRSQLVFQQEGLDGDLRVFSFLLENGPEDYDSLIMVWMDQEGGLAKIKDIEPIPVGTQIQNAIKASRTVEEFAALKAKWGPIAANMPIIPAVIPAGMDISVDEARSGINENFAKLLSLAITSPDEKAITPAQAQEKAGLLLAALPGMSEEKAALFWPRMCVYFLEEDGSGVYQFLYARHSGAEKAYEDDRVYELYQKQLFAAFDGNGNTPLYFRIKLDGESGELLEEIRTQYPAPNSPHYLSFFLQ